jgi:hypothetical protein
VSLGVVTFGCGHPATVAECEQIVGRIASLEIQKRARDYSQDELAREVEQVKQTLKESTMRDCVGKRITDRALECVRTAKTSEEIVDECFD